MSPVTAWSLLVAAAALEGAWAVALKRAEGFGQPGWALLGYGLAALSLYFLTLALRVLPAGPAYAAWVGLGVVAVGLCGAVFLGEDWSLWRLACMAVIVVGVAGLHLTPSAVMHAGSSAGAAAQLDQAVEDRED
jgi:quaternary ammonium compound-resistance protein SugE